MLRRSLLRASSSLHTPLPHRTIASRIRIDAWRQLGARPLARVAQRCYSDAASAKEEAKQAEGEKIQAEEVLSGKKDESPSAATKEPPEAAEVEKLRKELETKTKELETKTKEVASLKDSYLRQVADYRNLQDRTAREKQQTLDFALQKLLRDLLPSIDNLGHALSAVPAQKLSAPAASPDESHKDLQNLHEGVKLMETVLLDVLKKHGLSKIDPLGEKFDPKVHDAVFQAPQEGKEDGVVFHVQNPGYLLNGRVLRAPQVGVVKNS